MGATAASSSGSAAEPAGPAPLLVALDLRGRRCVVVGAGRVGTRRARVLVEAGADVVVVAPDATAEVRDLHAAGRLRWEPRAVRPSDLDGARLVVTAAGDPDANALAARAAPAGCLLGRADDAPAGDVTFPPTLRRGPVRVAVGTGGRAPAVAAWLAARLEDRLDDVTGLDAAGLTLLVELVAELRDEWRAGASAGTGVTAGPRDWRSALARTMLDGVLMDLLRAGRRDEAKERLRTCLSSS